MDVHPDSMLGPYRVVRLLGKGGMGVVYEAEHVQLRVRRALKVLARSGAADLRGRFLAEGRLLARLDHPRLVHVHDLGVEADAGLVWFAMDLVLDATGRPRTLEDLRRGGAVSEADAAGWFADLCAALAYVHGMGVAHRDVKLENALVGPDGRVVLSDFGISRILDPDLRNAAGLSATATFAGPASLRPLLGTLGYLAPEVKAGAPATPASDLYALGVLMFRLLTGLWYEPGTDALALLEPFELAWEDVLVPLLSEDPAARTLPAAPPAPKTAAPARSRLLRVGLPVAAAVLATLAGAAVWWRGRSRSAPAEDTFEALFATPPGYGSWEDGR